MTRTNLVDAYDNRSVVAKLVSMEERISGAETSVEASAEAAASSASAAAASQTAAKTSETSAKASADTAAATLSNTVDLSSKQTVTGAKTFAGDTAVTGSLVTSGNVEMAKLDIDTGKLTVGSGGSAEIHGPLTASNTSNSLKVADHDGVLTGNDVLSAKDIMTANGDANNLVHRAGDEPVYGLKTFYNPPYIGCLRTPGYALNWTKICHFKSIQVALMLSVEGANFQFIHIDLGTSTANIRVISFGNSSRTYSDKFCIAYNSLNNTWELWGNMTISWMRMMCLSIGTSTSPGAADAIVWDNDRSINAKPTAGDTYSWVADSIKGTLEA